MSNMSRAYYLTPDDAQILRQVVQEYRRKNQGMLDSIAVPRHPYAMEEAPGTPGDDLFPPEVYIIELPQASGTGTSTGTGTGEVGGIPPMREEDDVYIPGEAECRVWKTWPKGEGDDEEKLIEAQDPAVADFKHSVLNISPTRITGSGINKFRIAWRDKYGRYFTQQPSKELVELCAQETAERNVPYQCLLGVWDPDVELWCYDEAETVWAIDHRKGAPHAEEGWKGLYQEMSSNVENREGKIYVCVSLDCEEPEEGCNECEGTGT